ncbi:hypothetical protein D3C86_873200 [compost metagenome]
MTRRATDSVAGLPWVRFQAHWIAAAPSGIGERSKDDRFEQIGGRQANEPSQTPLGVGRAGVDEDAVHGPPGVRYVEAFAQCGGRVAALNRNLPDEGVREGVYEQQARRDRVVAVIAMLLGDRPTSGFEDCDASRKAGVTLDPGIDSFRSEAQEDAFAPYLSAGKPGPLGLRERGDFSLRDRLPDTLRADRMRFDPREPCKGTHLAEPRSCSD